MERLGGCYERKAEAKSWTAEAVDQTHVFQRKHGNGEEEAKGVEQEQGR